MHRLLLVAITLALSPSRATAQSGSVQAVEAIVHPEPVGAAVGIDVPAPPRILGAPATPHAHGKGLPPPLPATTDLPQPDSPPVRGSTAGFGAGPGAPCDLRLYFDRPAKAAGAATALIGEPSIAQVRDTCWQTGNWYAARSIDSGATWSHVSPLTTFPANDGGFCCDQRALYIPSADITVWVLQYDYSATTRQGGQRIAIANGRADLQAGTVGAWHSYYFTPASFGRPAGEWLDFPDIAYSDGFLYASTNALLGGGGGYTDAFVWRMPLSQLAAGGNVTYSYLRSSTHLGGTSFYRFSQNAAATMVFATHISYSTTRVYRWADVGGLAWTDLAVPDWTPTSTYAGSAPNGVNWLGRAQPSITGGYAKSGEYGFLWTCAPRAGRPQVYVRAIRIDAATHTLRATEDIWSSTLQIAWPAAAVNAAGDIGCCVAVANSTTLHPTTAYFVVDACIPSFYGQSLLWFTGNSSPTIPTWWGDYFSVQRHSHFVNSFVATGMTCRDGGENANSEPHYVWFGREQYQPLWPSLTVSSAPVTGVPITSNVTDRAGLRDGPTNFVRTFNPRQGYELSAPTTFTSGRTLYRFHQWVSNGVAQTINDPVLRVDDIGTGSDTAEARYVPQRTLQVRSDPASGVLVTLFQPDLNGQADGRTPFDRIYKDGSTALLRAPTSQGSNPFKQWILNGVPQPLGLTSLSVLVDTSVETATAVYFTHVSGSFTTYCTGCAGTSGVPAHSATGTPEIGNPITWRVAGARPSSQGVLYLGASRTTFNGLPLPLNLGFLGMGTSCLLCASVDITLPIATDAGGNGAVGFTIPNTADLIGSRVFTQAGIVDVGAGTRVPLVHSNALETSIGGSF